MSASPADPLVQAELPASVSVGPGEGGLTRLTVTTDTARAEVYLQGAHLTAWTPAGAAPVIWMSRASAFSRGIPIRGGVPVCFPWFGASAVDASARRHGFARVADWTLVESRDDGQQVGLGFRLTDDESTRASPWPHRFEAVYRVTVRDALVLSLEVTNRDTRALTYEELLHTYFAVSDVRQVRLAGLERVPYLDALDRSQTHRQDAGPLTVTGETDRIYLGTSAARILEDAGNGRRIRIRTTGAESTVVWNPWADKARGLKDFGNDEWVEMLCVETGNVGAAAVPLEPGARHTMTSTIELVPSG